jgi:hypothetical protein
MARKDFTQIAFPVVEQAIGVVKTPPIDEMKKAAIESGRTGSLRGGVARAKKLSGTRRKQIAKKAANVRWKNAEQKSYDEKTAII